MGIGKASERARVEQNGGDGESCVAQCGHQGEVDVRAAARALVGSGTRLLREERVGAVPRDFRLDEPQDGHQLFVVRKLSGDNLIDLLAEGVAHPAVAVEGGLAQGVVHVGPRGRVALDGLHGEGNLRKFEFEHRTVVVQTPYVGLAAQCGQVLSRADDVADGVRVGHAARVGNRSRGERLRDVDAQIPLQRAVEAEELGNRGLRAAVHDGNVVLEDERGDGGDVVRRESVAVFDDRALADFGNRELDHMEIVAHLFVEDVLLLERCLDHLAVDEVVGRRIQPRDALLHGGG